MMSRRVRMTGRGEPASPDAPAPTDEKLPDGQHADHWVLPEAERAKGYVQPLRQSYRHVGRPKPRYPLRELTEEERERYAGAEYVKFEEYPESESPKTGRFWTEADLEGGCGQVTTMPLATAETIAREPGFYGSTFCVHCRKYLPIGEAGEFVWVDDGTRVGT